MKMHGQPKSAPIISHGSEWWRFDRYEIKDGCIQPAAAAQICRYNPADGFTTNRPNHVQPAYQSLVKLVGRIKFHPGPRRFPRCLTEDSQAEILDWCNQYGLLGVLLSHWEAITLAPQRSESGTWIQHRYLRAQGQTVEDIVSSGDVCERPPSVLIRGLRDFHLVEETPHHTWARFFPSVEWGKRNTYAYPLPYTDEFCHLYAEPLFFFCTAARSLAGAITHLASPSSPGQHHDLLAQKKAADLINFLRRSLSPVVDVDSDGVFQQHWEAPSLLASFADMAAQDLALGQAILLCEACGLPFVSGAYQAKYCSVRCRHRRQKSNLRQQMRQARSLFVEGQTIRQIAVVLEQKPKIIKGWLAARKSLHVARPRTAHR
jgi:hypothetical protein